MYGPRMGLSHVIPQIFKKFISNRKKFIAFSPYKTFCYINDFIEFIFILMNKNSKKKFTTFNVGNPKEEILIKDLVYKIGKILNMKKNHMERRQS